MVKRLFAFLGLVIMTAALTMPALAVEGVSERQARKRAEAQKYPQMATEAMEKGNVDEAIEYFTKAIDSRAFKDQPSTMGELYFGRGNAWRKKGDCPKAIEDYTKAVETLPEGDIYFSRAACYLELKQDDLALADLDSAIKLDPDAPLYRGARCILLFNKKDFTGCLPDCEKALAAQPNDKNLLTATSLANEQVGNKPRAAELFRRLLTVDPGSTIASEGLARTQP